jgi:hypothetical protein
MSIRARRPGADHAARRLDHRVAWPLAGDALEPAPERRSGPGLGSIHGAGAVQPADAERFFGREDLLGGLVRRLEQTVADRARRAQTWISHGVDQMLSTLHSGVRWNRPVLEIADSGRIGG